MCAKAVKRDEEMLTWNRAGGGGSPVRQQHLDLLIVSWLVSSRILACLARLAAPLVAAWRQLVGRQRAGARCEGACDCHTPLSVPTLLALQHLCMLHNVLQAASTISDTYFPSLQSLATRRKLPKPFEDS